MNYTKYQNTRDSAWKILNDLKIKSLPIKITDVAKSLNIHCLSYQSNIEVMHHLNIYEHSKKTDGFSFCHKKQYYVFYNKNCSIERCRFTIAHELGHIILGHINEKEVTILNREPHPHDSPTEIEANMFAVRILSPACVLWALDVSTAEEIAKLCNISITSAQFRLQRLKLLYKRNKFLTSDFEKQVYSNFKDFIKNHHQ